MKAVQVQIEYYFCFDNLIKDEYLRRHMNDMGWVPIDLIANFPKVARMTNSIAIIHSAIASSSHLELDVTGQHLRLKSNWHKWLLIYPKEMVTTEVAECDGFLTLHQSLGTKMQPAENQKANAHIIFKGKEIDKKSDESNWL